MVAIIAHRGASSLAPENTMAAIDKALEIGVDYIEIDIRLTLDGIIVLMHDATVQRTTNGRGAVLSYYYKSLKKLDAGSWFSDAYANEPVPSLNEVMHRVIPKSKLLIEIKGSMVAQPLLPTELCELIRKHNAEEHCVVQSFNAPILKAVQRINPNIEINLLLNYYNKKLPFYRDTLPKLGNIYRFKFNNAVNPNFKWVNDKTVSHIHKKGKKIFCWTVDEVDEMQQLIDIGVDGIITNKPHILKELLEAAN